VKNRNTLIFLFLLVGLLLAIILTALNTSKKASADTTATPLHLNEAKEPSIPLIDQEAPHQFKTATFSLG